MAERGFSNNVKTVTSVFLTKVKCLEILIVFKTAISLVNERLITSPYYTAYFELPFL